MDKFSAMRLYCRIIETGHLSAAADDLNLAKGTVSKQLAQLEAYLGGRLLNRTTRKLTPTEAGLVYYEKAKSILEAVEESECVISGLTHEPRGTLKITAPMSFGTLYLAPLLARYHQAFPQVEVKLSMYDRQVDPVEEGYDLVIRIAELLDSVLIARRLATCHRVICASPDYLALNGTPETPEALEDHACILYSYQRTSSGNRWDLINREGEKTRVAVSGPLSANNGELICDALINGMGIAYLPTFVVGDAIRSGRLQIILPDWRPKLIDISLLYASNKHLSAKVRTFVDFAVAQYQGLPPWDKGLAL